MIDDGLSIEYLLSPEFKQAHYGGPVNKKEASKRGACYHCRSTGHWVRECPDRRTKRRVSAVKLQAGTMVASRGCIVAETAEGEAMDCMVDPEADVCLLGTRYWDQIGCSSVRAVTYKGERIPIVGLTGFTSRLEGLRMVARVHVSPGVQGLVLGRDWLTDTSTEWDPTTGTLRNENFVIQTQPLVEVRCLKSLATGRTGLQPKKLTKPSASPAVPVAPKKPEQPKPPVQVPPFWCSRVGPAVKTICMGKPCLCQLDGRFTHTVISSCLLPVAFDESPRPMQLFEKGPAIPVVGCVTVPIFVEGKLWTVAEATVSPNVEGIILGRGWVWDSESGVTYVGNKPPFEPSDESTSTSGTEGPLSESSLEAVSSESQCDTTPERLEPDESRVVQPPSQEEKSEPVIPIQVVGR